MKIYKVTMKSDYEWLMCGDFAQSASTLMACFDFHEDDLLGATGSCNWQSTPYQVADAKHSQYDAAGFVYGYFADWGDVDTVADISQCGGRVLKCTTEIDSGGADYE